MGGDVVTVSSLLSGLCSDTATCYEYKHATNECGHRLMDANQLTADAAAARTGWVGVVVILRLEFLLVLRHFILQHLQLLKLVQQLVILWNHLVPCRL